jgi:hypothetical protein
MREGAPNKRDYQERPEKVDPDYIVYLLEKVTSLATDYQIEPMQTVIGFSTEGNVDRESLFAFVHELEGQIQRQPIDDAGKRGELRMLSLVLQILEEEYAESVGLDLP